MQGLSIGIIASAVLYLHLSITVFRSQPRKSGHFFLAGSSLCLAISTGLLYFLYQAEAHKQVRWFFSLSLSGLILFLTLQNFFIRSMTGKLSWRYMLLFILLAAVPAVSGLGIFGRPVFFMRSADRWVFPLVPGGPWMYSIIGYFFIAFGSGCIFIVSWYRTAVLQREREQAKLLLIFSLTVIILAAIDIILHLSMGTLQHISLTPFIFVPWVAGYVIAIRKYQLLNITPEMVTRRILESIDEQVILVDSDGRPTYMNDRALKFFGEPFRKLGVIKIDGYILRNEESQLISTLDEENTVRQRSIVKLAGQTGTRPVMDFEITKVSDRFGDPLGFLLVGKEDRSVDSLVRKYQLTRREGDVIAGVIAGLKTKTIAEQLNISESTVKTHLSHVYRKLGVSNRVDLVNLTARGEE